MAGFVLNLIGIYVLSITHQVINPNGYPTGSVLHLHVTQSLVIFWVGTGIQLLEMIW
jgi:hypothetical protein